MPIFSGLSEQIRIKNGVILDEGYIQRQKNIDQAIYETVPILYAHPTTPPVALTVQDIAKRAGGMYQFMTSETHDFNPEFVENRLEFRLKVQPSVPQEKETSLHKTPDGRWYRTQ